MVTIIFCVGAPFIALYALACLFFRPTSIGYSKAFRARAIFAAVISIVGHVGFFVLDNYLASLVWSPRTPYGIIDVLINIALIAVIGSCLYRRASRVRRHEDSANQDLSIIPDSIKRETAADGTEVKVYKHTEDIEAMRERLMREK